MKPYEERKARERQAHGQTAPGKTLDADRRQASERTAEVLAKKVGVGARTMNRAIKVREAGGRIGYASAMNDDTPPTPTKHWPPEVLTLEEQESLRQEMRDSAVLARGILAERNRARLSTLAAEWNALCRRRRAEGETPELSDHLQRVGSEVLTLCHRLGIKPAMALITEGEA